MDKLQKIDSEVEAENNEVCEGWGRAFKQQRLARSLTTDDVAKETLLDIKIIEAIEAEDCAALPASSFVKGYLRSYARFLDVDAEPQVKAFCDFCGEDLPCFNTVSNIKEASSSDWAPRYLSVIVTGIVVLSIVFWWWSKVLAPAAVGHVADEPVVIDSALVEVIEVVEPVPKRVSNEPLNIIEVKQAVTAQPVELAPPLVADSLTLNFSGDSWTEVSDANGKRLYMDMGRVGKSKTITGETPFKILLGNARVVEVEFNGELYDLSQHIKRDNKARFTLGE